MMVAAVQETTPKLTRQELLEQNAMFVRENEDLHKRVQYLGFILGEKGRKFVNKYNEKKGYFKGQMDLILKLFFVDPTHGFTHHDLMKAFEQKYPAVNSKNVPRRTRELVTDRWLWTDYDENGVATFYLKLSKLVNGESVKEGQVSRVKQLKIEGDDKINE